MITWIPTNSVHVLDHVNYQHMIVPYRMALTTVEHWLYDLHRTWILQEKQDPIHHIQSRIKTRESIREKLLRQHRQITVEDTRNHLSDVAGIRVVCYFIRDVDTLVQQIRQQKDLLLLRERDYIRHPKPNGYRSYHLIVAVPVPFENNVQYYPVELQLRTLSMDYWSSMEHRICYKSHHPQSLVENFLEAEFIEYARQLAQMEEKMERYWI